MSSSKWDWGSLTEIANRFIDDVGGYVRNALSLDRIVETQDIATENLKNFQIAINQATGSRHKTGDPKKINRAWDKANTDYKGDIQRVTDFARGKMIVDTPEQIQKIKELLSDPEFLSEHGVCVVTGKPKDYFAEPKGNTGYRCLNYKIGIPVGENADGEIDHQVVELQVVASQIERINDLTHPFKRRAEDIVANVEDLDREMNKDELTEVFLCFATCRYYNGLVSRNNGYDALLDESNKAKFELTPNRQHKYLGHVRDLREIDRTRDDLGDYIARQEAPIDPADIKAGLDDDTGYWIRYGIYRPANEEPEFFRVTMVPNPNDPDLKSKSPDDLQEDDFVFNRIVRWDFEEAEWVGEARNLNKMNSSNFSDRYSAEEFHERMLRHESTLVRQYFEQSGDLDQQKPEGMENA